VRNQPSRAPAASLRLRVFLASPGDVVDERTLARKVLEQIRSDPHIRDQIDLREVSWDKPGSGTPMLATMTPQEAIASRLPTPSECDIVVVIFWTRMGTPLPTDLTKPAALRYLSDTEFDALDARYLSGTEWEYFDALQAAETNGKPKVLVYHRIGPQKLDQDDPEFDEKRQQWKLVKAFFESFRAADGSLLRGYKEYDTPTKFEEDLGYDLRELINELIDTHEFGPAATSVTPAAIERSLWEGSPFPGLRSFTDQDAQVFFGRGREVDRLVQILADSASRFIGVIGASGSGKSSLVWAGLIPRLFGQPAPGGSYKSRIGALPGSQDWLWARCTPGEVGDNPFIALAVAFKDILQRHGQAPRELAEKLEANPATLTELRDLALADKPAWAELLLFLDQFEELFTLVAPRYVDSFIELLDRARQDTRIRVVVTLRADFYQQCIEKTPLAELFRAGTYPLALPGPDSLHEMITRPAERAGLAFGEKLVDELLRDTIAEPGALPLLAFALAELYQARDEPTGTLTYAAYQSFGGLHGAVAERAEATYNGLDKEAQATAQRAFTEFTQVDERGVVTGRRTSLDRFAGNAATLRLIGAFIRNRLLVMEQGEGDQAVVEVAHEALLKSWPRLQAWVESTRDDRRLLAEMRLAAQQWAAKDRQRAYLWTNGRASEMIKMLDRLRPRLSATEQAFARPEAEHLLDELDEPRTAHDRRAQIGDRLAVLGDPRPGVGLRPDGMPDLDWCPVTGRGRTGSFHVGRYPVTYAQYRAFLEAPDGFRKVRWWEGLAASERQRAAPGTQSRKILNHPAENVSWYDATAFCRWLTARLRYGVRLPSEAEWRLAATGGNFGFSYPWGRRWRSECANTASSHLSRTTAVGMYPCGRTPCGALDMSGNVCEWTADLGSEDGRGVLCGGAWYLSRADAQASARIFSFPYERLSHFGFRVACNAPGR